MPGLEEAGSSHPLRIIESAANFPHLTHTEEFLAALRETVRPIAIANGG